MEPITILREAVKAVPAIKYALGVAGIAAAVALVVGWLKDPKLAIFGPVVMLGLMFILVVFAWFAKHGGSDVRPLALILAWAFVTLIVATSTFIFTGFFFSWPRPLEAYVSGTSKFMPTPIPTSSPAPTPKPPPASTPTPTPKLTPVAILSPSPVHIPQAFQQPSAQSTPSPTPAHAAIPVIADNPIMVEVNRYKNTQICVNRGDRIQITARGQISLGGFIGYTGPNGKDVFGPNIPVDRKYYKETAFSFGALMCKLDSDRDWQKCGSGITIIALANGCLEFDINDIIQIDNNGKYIVTVNILRAP